MRQLPRVPPRVAAAAGGGLAGLVLPRLKSDALRALDAFEHRHLGPRASDVASMLAVVGKYKSLDELSNDAVPAQIRAPRKLTLPAPLTETQALAKLKGIAQKNKVVKNMIGMGYYETHTPGVILRNMLESPGWYTSYSPYQAEIAQGRLESLLNFQTLVCDLTSMDIANASLLDEATAAAEALNMAYGFHNTGRAKYFVAADVHPQTLDVVRTRAEGQGVEVVVGDPTTADLASGAYAGVLLQYPSTHGALDAPRLAAVAAAAKASKTILVVASDLLALTVAKSPGELGADIVVGSAQRFGVPPGFGGPHAAFLGTRKDFQRRMPGRVIGVSIDSAGKPALRMAMQTREQHIRRDKATSNICTAQALLANMAAMFAVYHGPAGLRDIASRVHALARVTAGELRKGGFAVHGTLDAAAAPVFFDTLTVATRAGGPDARAIAAAAEKAGVNLRVIDDATLGISCDEKTTTEHLVAVLKAFGLKATPAALSAAAGALPPLAASLGPAHRASAILAHPIFNSHHSETQLLRYIHKLQSRDLSLTTSMISLGSCTMKLNATSEMIPITWPEFTEVHPFAPKHQALGYETMIAGLSKWLAEITGFAAVSVQPNSGAAGEYAGLMAIRAYLKSTGQGHRSVCLIPTSAHGTNPASAVMAGMTVVVVNSDEHGNVDMADLKAKAAEHAPNLAALMVTYPSTYGVFEEGIKEIIACVHGHGGQVYMDGANMNAQVAITSPGYIGADVCHLNLHKTFCIPHGGGGPGVGAIGVAAHLAPHLPGHPVVPTAGHGAGVVEKGAGSTISAAPYGSALILPISWMYIAMLGEAGLKKATQLAILNANYMAARLAPHYNILFTGKTGRVAHEFILDIRPIKAASGGAVTEVDVAKRLQDYGFHAPTMSWPVGGTLMVEPTESEDRAELDRFVDAMISIRKEAQDVIDGKVDKDNNVLKNAPHTAQAVISACGEGGGRRGEGGGGPPAHAPRYSPHHTLPFTRLPRAPLTQATRGTAPTPASWQPTPRPGRAPTSSGPLWGASMTRTATACSSAPAPASRSTGRREGPTEPSRFFRALLTVKIVNCSARTLSLSLHGERSHALVGRDALWHAVAHLGGEPVGEVAPALEARHKRQHVLGADPRHLPKAVLGPHGHDKDGASLGVVGAQRQGAPPRQRRAVARGSGGLVLCAKHALGLARLCGARVPHGKDAGVASHLVSAAHANVARSVQRAGQLATLEPPRARRAAQRRNGHAHAQLAAAHAHCKGAARRGGSVHARRQHAHVCARAQLCQALHAHARAQLNASGSHGARSGGHHARRGLRVIGQQRAGAGGQHHRGGGMHVLDLARQLNAHGAAARHEHGGRSRQRAANGAQAPLEGALRVAAVPRHRVAGAAGQDQVVVLQRHGVARGRGSGAERLVGHRLGRGRGARGPAPHHARGGALREDAVQRVHELVLKALHHHGAHAAKGGREPVLGLNAARSAEEAEEQGARKNWARGR